MPTRLIISFTVSILLIGWAFWITSGSPEATPDKPVAAVMEDGVQTIDITAKGGYSPRTVTAKAGVRTVIRVRTNNTFDCSAAVVVPKLSYQKFLQPSGIEEIQISPEQATGTLQGLCAMGMYNFQIRFE